MLSRADYPNIWGRRGYPPLPGGAALYGDVVHAVVERVTKAMLGAGITSVSGGGIAELLGKLGGWKAVVLDAIDAKLAVYDGNPRVSSELLDRTRQELNRRIVGVVDQAKDFLSAGGVLVSYGEGSGNSSLGASVEGGRKSGEARSPVRQGTHVERVLISGDLRLMGKVDVLVVDETHVSITDIKTGAEDEGHVEQLRTYELLWDLDRQSNPDQREATQLKLAYPGVERTVHPSNSSELRAFEGAMKERIRDAELVVNSQQPEANPSVDNCSFCHVKHLCDDYWSVMPVRLAEVALGEWIDLEAEVVARNGNRSWHFVTSGAQPVDVFVQTGSAELSFPIGARLRLLGVQRVEDLEGVSSVVLSMNSRTEWFILGA